MLEVNIRKNMINHREIELIAKKIQDDNPGMTKQTAIQYAEKKHSK